jgi:hypothetical protein
MTTETKTRKRIPRQRTYEVPAGAPMVDVATAARLTCPFCATLCAPPCVCPGCGVGLPAGVEPDWSRNLTGHSGWCATRDPGAHLAGADAGNGWNYGKLAEDVQEAAYAKAA